MFYDNDTYLENVQKRIFYFNEVYANCMGKNPTRNRIYMCGQKEKI